MRIVIAGSSGFLGSHLVRTLVSDGHDVQRLVRRAPRAADETRWDPAGGTLDPAVLATADAVVNLAGANIGRPWTNGYRKKIRDSRLDTTNTLVRAVVAAEPGPSVLVNASGVDFYGETGDRAVDEQSPPGSGFLPDLCQEWEGATTPARDAGVRVLLLRTSPPLDRGEGLLKPLMLPFRLGVGGRLGSGRQYQPWISLPDWIGAVRFLLERDDVAGPVNLTGPRPATNAEFTKALGHVLHRPTVLPVPAFALRTVLGDFSAMALGSKRVLPRVLTSAGYQFRHPDVAAALKWAVEHA